MRKSLLLFGVGLFLIAGLLATLFVPAPAAEAQVSHTAEIRVAHLAPFAAGDAPVVLRINGAFIDFNFEYGESVGYVTVNAGHLSVQLLDPHDHSNLFHRTYNLEAGKVYTAVAVGGTNQYDLDVQIIDETTTAPAAGSGKLLLGHLAPFAAGLDNTIADVRLQNGDIILDDVRFGDVGSYLELPAGSYDLKVTSADGATILIDPAPVTLGDGDLISAFASGDGVNQDLAVYAFVNDGDGFFIPAADPARLYVAHLAPFAADAAVTVEVNGTAALTNFNYGNSTGYLEFPAGDYEIDIIPDGAADPAISGTVTLEPGVDYTAAATGDGANQPLGLLALVDDNSPPAAGNAKLRLGHLAPFADTLAGTTADVCLQDGTPVLAGVQFGDVDTTYSVELPAGTYDLKITTPGCDTTLIDPAPIMVNDGDIVSAFATGEGANQDLAVFAIINGAEGIFIPAADPARLYVTHLAPFAADAAVTVEVNGAPALTDFNYGDSTGYLEFEAGTYDIDIIPAAASDPAISGSVTLEPGVDYTAVATGDGANQPLGLAALVDDNSAPVDGNAKIRFGHLAPFADTLAGTAASICLQDGTPVLPNVRFGDIDTTYSVELPAGTYNLKVATPDCSITLIDPQPVTVNDGDILSVFAAGEGNNQRLGVFAIINGAEGQFLPLEGDARVYLAHLAPFAADAGVTVELDGPVYVRIDDFQYGNYTGYLPLPAGTYDAAITPTGAADPAISGQLTLSAGDDYTVAAIGDGANQPLGLSVLVDDNSAPAAGSAKIRLGHLAPFADTLAGTTADVCLQDGTPVLPGVQFGDVDTTYSVELPAGTYDLKISTPGCGTTLIDPAPITVNDGDIVSAFATGDGVNQNLAVYAITNGLAGQFIPAADPARLYVAHLAPFAADAEVTVRVNGADALPGFNYGDSTGYLEFEAGVYDIEIIPAGASDPAISGSVTLEPGVDYTAVAIGDGANQPLDLLALVDDNSAPADGSAKIRFGHLAPFADTLDGTTADICLQDGTPVLPGVEFGNVDTSYAIELPAGTYNLKVAAPGCGTTLIDPEAVTLNDGDILSVFATGDGGNQELAVFAIINGGPGFFLANEDSALKVVHLAPFAADPAETAVDVAVNAVTVLTGVLYGQSSDFLPVAPGLTQVEVFPAGSETAVLDEQLDLDSGTEYIYTVIGNGDTQPISSVVVAITPPPPGMGMVNFGHMMVGDADVVDLRDAEGNIVMDDVAYGDMMSKMMMPGTYDLQITSADGSQQLLDLNPMTLAAGDVQTMMTMGAPGTGEMDVMGFDATGSVTDMTGYQLFMPLFNVGN